MVCIECAIKSHQLYKKDLLFLQSSCLSFWTCLWGRGEQLYLSDGRYEHLHFHIYLCTTQHSTFVPLFTWSPFRSKSKDQIPRTTAGVTHRKTRLRGNLAVLSLRDSEHQFLPSFCLFKCWLVLGFILSASLSAPQLKLNSSFKIIYKLCWTLF